MKVISSLVFLVSLAGSASAGTVPAAADGPEMAAGVIGVMLATGVVYLVRRRKRS